MSEDKSCHFHGNKHFPGTHIMRITCPYCGDYHVVYTCDSCTKAVRSYEDPAVSAHTMCCSECKKIVLVRERWKIIGKA